MPVIRLRSARFSKMVGTQRSRILEKLPYVGLDIEGVEGDIIRVEYSPNRPDFGTDFGIARALRGILGKEVGLPKFPVTSSGIAISYDKRLSKVRPFISCMVATGLRLDDEDVRQIISLQEDLHNGLGRKRRVVAIGLHDLDAVKPPLSYHAVDSGFKFVPLGGSRPQTVESILADTPEGQAYGPVLGDTKLFPIITDSIGTVLSLPPVINGNATRVSSKTRGILVDVTSTDRKAGDDVMAVLATTLAEAGGKLKTVSISYPGKPRVTPDLEPEELRLDEPLIRSVLGMDMSSSEISKSLARSRLGARGKKAFAPRYRIDLLHPVDLAEEVALGYGVDRIRPVYPPSNRPGSFDVFEDFLDSVSTVMAGAGMIEMMTFELTDRVSLYTGFQRPAQGVIAVQNPKSLEHSVLRDALLPGLMSSLSGNVKSDYPQRVFEIGRVYLRKGGTISERWHLGSLVAHSTSSFSEAKMFLESVCRVVAGRELIAKEGGHWAFSEGRCAEVSLANRTIGHVGELRPETIDAFGLGVPVSGFEVDLSAVFELLK